MTVEVKPAARWEWSPLPREGSRKVDFRVLHAQGDHHAIMLRFDPDGTIDEHPHEAPVVVVCLEGAGYTSVEGETVPLKAGEQVTWPAGESHRLWTESEPMTTLLLHFQG
ncbi:MAG TPA: cupin domain-containing protein [Candidatus Dormibacteraeota bacterium]